MWQVVSLLLFSVLLLAFIALPSSAAETTCKVDDTTPAQGQTVQVAGAHWAGLVSVFFAQGGSQTLIATDTAGGPTGSISTSATIPGGASDGHATLEFKGTPRDPGGGANCDVSITVV
jgi:hypothetical protein